MCPFLRRRLRGKGLDVARLLGVVDALVRVRLDDLLDVEADDVLSCGVLLLVSSWTPLHARPQWRQDCALNTGIHTHIGNLVFPVGG